MKYIVISLLLFTSCITTSNLQCDEVYGADYDCEIQHNYTFNSYTPYRPYYPNTQTIYYVPTPKNCPEGNNDIPQRKTETITGKRPNVWNKPVRP